MKNLRVFPKIFLQTFSILASLIILIHLLVFFIFPKTYLETRKREIQVKANEISNNIQGKDLRFIEESLEFYSKSSEINAFIKGKNKQNELHVKNNNGIDLKSSNNSLIIEERKIKLNTGQDIFVQFISTTDMQKDAKDLSFRFLPYSLFISFLFSIVISLIYAKSIKNNIQEIKDITDKMMRLDKTAILNVNSKNEVGQLKGQINDLYKTLLKLIDDLEIKNKEVLKLEKLKYDFFRGASHELKTPLASLKTILENMKYNIGKYKNKDLYIGNCIDIVDDLSQNISQILSISSLENLKNDEEIVKINDVLQEVLNKYILLATQKNIKFNNNLEDEKIYIGKTAIKIVLSNLISNAVKYTKNNGMINIGVENNFLYIENSFDNDLDLDNIFELNFDLNKENSNGLGLYIVRNILLNYGVKYRVDRSDIGIIFFIELNTKGLD